MLRDLLPCRREPSPRSQPDLPKQVTLLLFQSLVRHFRVSPALPGGWERHSRPGDAPLGWLSLLPHALCAQGSGSIPVHLLLRVLEPEFQPFQQLFLGTPASIPFPGLSLKIKS